MAEIRIKLNEHYWIFKVVTLKQMKKKAGDETTAGLTLPDARQVLISEDSVNLRIVLHELTHVFYSDLNLNNAQDITAHDVEEIMCDLVAHKGEVILRKGRKILRELKKQLEDDNE